MHAHVRRASTSLPMRRTRPGSLVGTIMATTAVFGVIVTILLGDLGGSYALWNGKAVSNAGMISAGTNTVTETVTTPLTYTYKNGQTSTTGGMLVTNTGDVSAIYRTAITLGAGSSTPLASAVAVSMWPTTALSNCTATASVPGSAYAGSWASVTATTTPPLTGTLAAGASAAYCLRTTMNVNSAAGIASGDFVTAVFATVQTVGGTWTSAATASATQTFADNIAPATPGGLTSSDTKSTSTTLKWNASSDNVGVTRYLVQRDGVTVATVAAPSTVYIDSSLKAGVSYTYTATAQDAAGNSSAASGAAIVTTPQAIGVLLCTQPDDSNAVISWTNPPGVSTTATYDVLVNGVVVSVGFQSYYYTQMYVTSLSLLAAGITRPASEIPVQVRVHGQTTVLFSGTISTQWYWLSLVARCGS